MKCTARILNHFFFKNTMGSRILHKQAFGVILVIIHLFLAKLVEFNKVCCPGMELALKPSQQISVVLRL